MARLSAALFTLTVTLWVGSLWAIGFLAAPTLFNALGDRMLAGDLAGRLFSLVAWLGMGCAAYQLLFLLLSLGWQALRSTALWIVVAMLLLTLAGHFGIAPLLAGLKAEVWPRDVMQTILRDRFASWHGVSSGVYVVESLLGAALVLVQRRVFG